MPPSDPSRRAILTAAFATGFGLRAADAARAQELPPTPACHDGDEPTVKQTEGPYFKPRSPERADLREAGIKGRACELGGLVLTRNCRPVARVLVDLWHADGNGEYDNSGFRLRGHVFTDADGRYGFRTVMPGVYEGRTRHYHVKVQAPNRSILTTQFYFPGEATNRRDPLYRRDLLLRVAEAGDDLHARFDVVLDIR